MLSVSMMIDAYSAVLSVNVSRPCPLGSLSELTAGSSSSSVSVDEVT